jgi:hypothetical protein
VKGRLRALEVLLRLEQCRLDEARAAIREADMRHETAVERRLQARARVERERRAGSGNPALQPWLACYLEQARAEAAALAAEIDRLAACHQLEVARALQTRLECRRLDLLAARTRQRARIAENRRRERQLEALLPHRRPGSAGGR